jgi:dTDP-4-amino-4,6-dideoxygalactose transaminase
MNLGFKVGSFPEAETNARQTLSLPMYPELSDADQEQVATTCLSWCKRRGGHD